VGAGPADNRIAVETATPPSATDGRAVSRLLEHYARMTGLVEAPHRGRDELEAAVGDELAQRLVGALAGDHAIPARLYGD
jgi:hypothetical protein